MKKLTAILLAACALPLAAHAEPLLHAMPLAIDGSKGLQRLTLPPDVYRQAAYADLRDLRVLDAQDAAMPFAYVPQPLPVALLAPLPLYAVPTAAASAGGASHLQLQTHADGSIRLELAANVADGANPVRAYLIDRGERELRLPISALQLDWQASRADVLLTLQIEQSDDLQHWQPLTGPATLAQLDNGRQQLRQARLPLAPPDARYLRLQLQGELPAGLRLTRARGEYLPAASPQWLELPQAPARRVNDGGFEFDLGGRYPLRALQFVYTGPRLLLPADLLSRPTADSPWRRHGSQVISKLDGAMAPIAISSNDRYWKLQPDSRVGAPVASALRLIGHYHPADVVFVAQGEPPYRLQIGDGFLAAGDLPYATLLPDNQATPAIGSATISGPLRPDSGTWLSRVGHQHWRKLALWLVLLSGVAVMAWMVLRLGRKSG